MKRREFLKSMTALAAGGVLPAAPAVWSPAKAQARQETLLIVSESGPNNIDIHGVGTNVPGYEVSWNCYDRLISHEMKTLENGTQYYDRDKFKMELADDMNVGDMSVTFKLKKKAVFHDGTPVTAKDVKWSLSHLPDGSRLAVEARAIRRRGRQHHPCRLPAQGPSHGA
jgi:peptide/nickel transport system substrate-binding protein